MKLFFLLTLIALPMCAADKPATKKTSPAPAAVTIPAGAVETEPGTWRHTDAQGKTWNYRKTPWGVSRVEDRGEKKEVRETEQHEEKAPISAVEDGDTVKFERAGPFGRYKWQRKKTELNDEEKAALERSRTVSRTESAKE